jgi:outer membrane protein OmpA-like peptidoglycan-associated protein
LVLVALAAPAPARAQEPPPASDDQAVWEKRDSSLHEQDAVSGGVGLLHTQHAESGAPGQLRVGFTAETFAASFLCAPSAPCANPRGGANLTTDSMTHLGGTLSVSATVTDWLEAYGATGAYGDADAANHPALLQVLGDTQLGVKVFHPVSPVFHLGGSAELDLVNGSGAVGLAGSGTGARFRALATADLRGKKDPIPLRISFNAAYSIDNTAQVLSDYEASTGVPVTRIERFGLEVNRVDHLDLNLGAEAILASERVRPFLEYSVLLPVNRQGYACTPGSPYGDQCLANDYVVPSKLTVGARFFPWKPGFSVTAALDVGLTGVTNFIQELSPAAPWTFYVGLGWAIETWPRPVREETRLVETVKPAKPIGRLLGLVHPKGKTDGIFDAVVVFDDHADITSRATGADGRFAVPVDAGAYKLVVHAKGYRDGSCAGEMGTAAVDVEVDCPLEPALVEVTANEITIQQQIQFQVDSANILPESDALMLEIADTLVKNPRITRVEVQGHTDSSGATEYNQALSEQRASAVRTWLLAHGVPADRLVAHGYGEDRPLMPNVTKGMKALNRRVQFIIVEQTPAKTP